jgi:carbonic anhydrase
VKEMTVTYTKVTALQGTIQLFVQANHGAQDYLAAKTAARLTHVVVGCSDSRSVSHHHVRDAPRAAFYNTAGQTMDAKTIAHLKAEYSGRIVIAHKKCGACHAAHEYRQGKEMPTPQLTAVVEAANPDEHTNGELRRTSLESAYNLVYVDVDTLGAVERGGEELPLSGGQYPLAIVWRIGLRYSAAELVHGSDLENPSHLFDVSSLDSLTAVEHGSLQYAMAHALHGKGSFAHADAFIAVVAREDEAVARHTLDTVLAHDAVFREYLSRGAKAYLCVRNNGKIEDVYEMSF